MTPINKEYLRGDTWPDYQVGGATFSFSHLRELCFGVSDGKGAQLMVGVTYKDHVFTKDPTPATKRADAFPNCTRQPYGVFCPERYFLSLSLPQIIPQIAGQRVWNLKEKDNYAQLPIVTLQGTHVMYAIIFSVWRVDRNIPYDLHLTVRTAHVRTEAPPETFGDVKFEYLAKSKMNGAEPARIYGERRKKPELP